MVDYILYNNEYENINKNFFNKNGEIMKKNSRNTKGKIVSAAWQLFYQQGYDDTTVEEIVEASGTSRARTRCLHLCPICLTRNMMSLRKQWTRSFLL